MAEKQTVTCVVCPVGCSVEVSYEDGKVLSVTGNRCPRGEKYASAEVLCPERILTSTAVLDSSLLKRIPVRTDIPVPKAKISDCMKQINALRVQTPVKMGNVLLAHICGTDANLIACRSVTES